MLARVLTGLVLAPLVAWLLVAGPVWLIGLVLAAAVAQSGAELLAMHAELPRASRRLGTAAIAAITLSPLWMPGATLAVAGALASLLLASTLAKPDDLQRQSRIAALLILGVGYVGLMGAALTAIAALPAPAGRLGPIDFGPACVLAHLVLVFCGDTGAYFAGRAFGRRKLYPLVSPKKTIAGSVGGLIASIVGVTLLCRWALPQLASVEVAAAAAWIGAMAQVGDLAESMFKRATATKDSGALLPGHGGMLDRLDGVLFAAPWTYAWLLLLHGPGIG